MNKVRAELTWTDDIERCKAVLSKTYLEGRYRGAVVNPGAADIIACLMANPEEAKQVWVALGGSGRAASYCDKMQTERDDARMHVAQLRADEAQALALLYHTGATRGDLVTRAERAKLAHNALVGEVVERDETIASLRAQLEAADSLAECVRYPARDVGWSQRNTKVVAALRAYDAAKAKDSTGSGEQVNAKQSGLETHGTPEPGRDYITRADVAAMIAEACVGAVERFKVGRYEHELAALAAELRKAAK